MTGVTSTTIHQHCSVCKADFDMDIIKQGSKEDVLWLKCPGCEGYLPYMPKDELDDADRIPQEQSLALEDIEVESATEYSEDRDYEVGEVIHHRSWNDYGKVVAKDKLPGNRRTIWVQFIRQGRVQLLEGVVN
ncbi:MAG: hypothetical protein OEX18_06600 [Candidatus Krumholzibacteria bacterium]|nr:hypothetical protein [Candidatus Krumholzibacteria bacterium]MDH4336935.1 hypothetical protein [Candidatus Krumholzibacteria bacterium]MDH5269769.1 hypothetical protein [Candidatus Krumholzibacteria bacterium]